MSTQIRFAKKADAPLVLGFIQGLAEYEKLSHDVVATVEDLERTLFGSVPQAEVILAFQEAHAVGFCLFFHNYSTFLARRGIYIEDLFVNPEARNTGAGKALLREVAMIALERGCGRLEWSVLDWNTPAIEFYRSIGAKPMNEWTAQRLLVPEMKALCEV